MTSLPVISGFQAVKGFQKAGWVFSRQRGSHVIMLKKGSIVSLSIPQHRELAPGTLRSLIRVAGLTVEEFVELL
jgi:predicted RNA binding protein YcfA (HicA-like mRNA interferase family)